MDQRRYLLGIFWIFQLPEDSFLLTENRDIWGSLCDAKCWGDLEAARSEKV